MKKKLFIITGATRGIGAFLVEKISKSQELTGHIILGFYNRTIPDRDKLASFMFFEKLNMESSMEGLSEITDKYTKNADEIILLNCAGINYNSFAHKTNIDNWIKVIDVNLIGTFQLINAILPAMREKNYGRIINLSSVVGQTGVSGTSCYAASKSGLTGMIKPIAKENATKGVTINNLNLGYFDIGMIEQVPAEIKTKVIETIPCKSLGNPDNIYNAVKFLIDSEYVNGTSIDINGGIY